MVLLRTVEIDQPVCVGSRVNDKVYFANAYDGGALYCMNPNETEITKLSGNCVSSINAGGDYLYYYMESGSSGGKGLGYMGRTAGIYRSKKNGKRVQCLDRSYAVMIQLCGNYLYYQDYDTKTGTSLAKIKIDKSDKTTDRCKRRCLIDRNGCIELIEIYILRGNVYIFIDALSFDAFYFASCFSTLSLKQLIHPAFAVFMTNLSFVTKP